MNAPSLDKYEASVVPGGQIFLDSSLIDRKVTRDDVEVYYIPATKLASDNELSGLANMIMIGLMMKHSGVAEYDVIDKTMAKVVSAKKQNLLDLNKKAVEMGYNYTK